MGLALFFFAVSGIGWGIYAFANRGAFPGLCGPLEGFWAGARHRYALPVLDEPDDAEADTEVFPVLAYSQEPIRSPWARPIVYDYPVHWS